MSSFLRGKPACRQAGPSAFCLVPLSGTTEYNQNEVLLSRSIKQKYSIHDFSPQPTLLPST